MRFGVCKLIQDLNILLLLQKINMTYFSFSDTKMNGVYAHFKQSDWLSQNFIPIYALQTSIGCSNPGFNIGFAQILQD